STASDRASRNISPANLVRKRSKPCGSSSVRSTPTISSIPARSCRRTENSSMDVPTVASTLPNDADITRDEIARTEALIRPFIRRTPTVAVEGADFGLAAGPIQLKLECLQHTGTFKARGAFANLITRPVPQAGVIAASGGNHGVAVAYAAMKRGVR